MKYLIIMIFLSGCLQQNTKKFNLTPTQSEIIISDWGRKLNIREFEYKGHTYITTMESDKLETQSTTHAGHCKCNLR